MKHVAIIGATGSLGRTVAPYLQEKGDYKLTLFSRHACRLQMTDARVINGDVFDSSKLDEALSGQDTVFVSLTGDLGKMAQSIVASAKRNHVSQIIFISSMGIYNELPERIGVAGNLEHNPVLQCYREGADIIESSGLNYTIIRPGWFDNGPADYEITHKGEMFGGRKVSRRAIADLVYTILESQNCYSCESIGINRPE